MIIRRINLAFVGIAFIVYVATFGRENMNAVLFFMPFTMIPFAITGALAWGWRAFASQVVLLITHLSYSAWFVYLYVDAIIVHPDPQSPIAF